MDKINMTGDFEQFLESFDEQNYFMIEEEIDIEIQNKYFKHSQKNNPQLAKEEVMSNVPLLSDKKVSKEEKKRILSQLASLKDVEAYRVLEKECRSFDDEELNTWSILAYNECKMILHGSLKNEQQIFISTGLGGKNGKFRYFVALLPHQDIESFSEFHQNFIHKELEFTLSQNNSELEKEVEIGDSYMSYKVLVPVKANIPKIFRQVIENCNQLAPFVSKQFIITNVGEMDAQEIQEFIDETNEDDDNEIMEDIVSLN